jgi:class 3 adenylate cyclase
LVLVSLLAGYVGVTIAEQVGLIPYGPVLLAAPFKAGRLSPSWLATFGGFDFGLLVAMFGFALLIIQRWQVRESQLAEANRFLGRFLSPQVTRMVKEHGMSSVLEKRRSQLTAIACDLRGFTAFSENVAPEEVIEMLERYYAAIGQAVSEYGGIIKDYSGDGVLILIGAPTPYPDHARRAISTALKIRELVREMCLRWRNLDLELSLGIGIASGYVTVGAIGGAERMEYVAVGRAVNLAARLCERAGPDSILLDQRTFGLIAAGDATAGLHFEQVESAQLKGFHRPVRILALLTGDDEPSEASTG